MSDPVAAAGPGSEASASRATTSAARHRRVARTGRTTLNPSGPHSDRCSKAPAARLVHGGSTPTTWTDDDVSRSAPRRRPGRRPSSAARGPRSVIPSSGEFLPFEASAAARDRPAHPSGRRRRDPPARPRRGRPPPSRRVRAPRTRAGPVGQRSMARASVSCPASTAARTRPSAVSMPLIPFAASPNSTALSTSVCGAWSVAIASAVPSRSAARQASGVRRRAQRRVHPQRRREGRGRRAPRRATGRRPRRPPRRPAPRAGDPLVGEREVMRRHVAGDRQARRPSPAGRGRATAAVETWVRCSRAPGTSRHDVGRGSRGRARPPPPRPRPASRAARGRSRRSPSFASAPSVCVGVLGMVDDRQPERARVGQRVAQDRGRPDRRPVVARTRPTPASASSPSAASVSPARPAVTAPYASSSTGDPDATRRPPGSRQHAGLVERRRRVRHRADGREPAVRRRGQPGRDGLGILVARLAQVGVQIDEARARRPPPRHRCRRHPRRPARSPPRGPRRERRSRPDPRGRPPGRPARPADARGRSRSAARAGRDARPAGTAAPSGSRRRSSPGR